MTYCMFSFANGVVSLALPPAPGNFLSDRFRAGELDCSMAIGSGVNVEFGVMGVINNGTPTISSNPVTGQNRDVCVYGRMIIPIGAPKGRVDCNRLYEMELRKRSMEIERLEIELRNLRSNLKFENRK